MQDAFGTAADTVGGLPVIVNRVADGLERAGDAFDLPYRTLILFTDDPFGDLAAGRYDAWCWRHSTTPGWSPRTRRR